MSLAENVRLALTALRANKLRAFLTMLGIIIGVAAVITLISVGQGVEVFVAEQFQGLGNNLLFVFPGELRPDGPPRQRRGAGLTNDDVAALSDPLLTPDLLRVAPEYSRTAVVTHGRYEARTFISGTTADFPDIRNFYPVAGRFFDSQDDAGTARVAVLGQTVYEELFPNGEPPLGETIKINGINFEVIGLMEEKGGSGFNDQDDLVLVPLSTAQRRLFPARRSDGKMRVDFIYAQVADEERQEAAIVQMELVLRDSHGLSFDEDNDFTVLSQAEVIRAFAQVTSVLTTFLAVIAGISLIVGGIGIMNIMLVSVTERTREIGLRKAVGAKQGDILMQFLTEAVTLGLAGGLIGLLLGIAGIVIIGSLSENLRTALAWESVVLAIGFSGAAGLFFGLYPARRAARLNPIDALRYE
jgi:putative ABC transport system permease protein